MKLRVALFVGLSLLLASMPAFAQTYELTEVAPSANSIPKNSNGTGANIPSGLTDDGTTISATSEILAVGTVKGQSNVQAGTTYTIVAGDCGKTLIFTNAGAVTVTVAAAAAPAVGTTCAMAVLQQGAGKVSVNGSAVTAATLVSNHSYTATTGTAGSQIGLLLTTIGTTAYAFLSGEGS